MLKVHILSRRGADLTHEQYMDHWVNKPLAYLASHEHISQRTLVRKFRDATGMSVLDWITRERVSEAKVLVEQSTSHSLNRRHGRFRLRRNTAT